MTNPSDASSEILTRLLTMVAQQHHLDVSTVTLETPLAEAGLDSLATAELLFSIEDEFKISLGDVAAQDVPATFAELVALIQAQLAQKNSAS